MLTGRELNREIRQVGFVIMLIALLVLMIYELSYFISAALGAFTLYMLLRGLHRKLVDRGWNRMPATILLVFGSLLAFLVAGGGVVSLIMPKISEFNLQIVIEKVNGIHDFVLRQTGYNIFSKDVVDRAIESGSALLPNLFAATGSILVNGFMTFVLLFFMLQGREKIELAVQYLPFKPHSISMLRHETNSMVVSNAIGIPIVMLGQGIAAWLGYWMLGAGNPVVWGLVTGIFSVVPIVGSASVWILLAINMMVGGQVLEGVILILYGALITSNVDNVIRMYLLKKYADVHPAITLFGIILGMNLFGFWGIIFGPLMISGFILLFKIYRNEFLGCEPSEPAQTVQPSAAESSPEQEAT